MDGGVFIYWDDVRFFFCVVMDFGDGGCWILGWEDGEGDKMFGVGYVLFVVMLVVVGLYVL